MTRRKPLNGRFFNNTSGKIGKQLLQNRLQHMDRLDAKWLDRKWTNDLIRVMLKKMYFFFNDWPYSWIILPHYLFAIDCDMYICISCDQIILLKSMNDNKWGIKHATKAILYIEREKSLDHEACFVKINSLFFILTLFLLWLSGDRICRKLIRNEKPLMFYKMKVFWSILFPPEICFLLWFSHLKVTLDCPFNVNTG